MAAGVVGAILGMGLAMMLSHGVLVWLARAHRVWDPRHDALFALIGAGTAALALWLHWEALARLAAGAG